MLADGLRLGMRKGLTCLELLVFFAALARGQSTEAIITGQIIDWRTRTAIPNARIRYHNFDTGSSGSAYVDARGYYSIPSIPPGVYTFRAEAPEYQGREIQKREIFVAARLELDFSLRRLEEVPEAGEWNSSVLPDRNAILPVLGPDLERGRAAPVDATETQSEVRQAFLSYVIDPKQISQAPLSARNVYSLLVTLPGVSASQSSGRGLQISANGQRASASNYLLDGVQNNDFVNTGAFSPTAPEAIQEYRVSISNYSAEYGQTGGFVANAITRRGGNDYHGIAYGYLDNDALAANTFWNNANGGSGGFYPRNPFKRLYAGYAVSGPVWRDRLFFSSSFERMRSRSIRNPKVVVYLLPSRLRQCNGGESNSIIDLYNRFPVRNAVFNNEVLSLDACQSYGTSVVRKPVSVDRYLAVERVDYQSPDSRHRLMARVALYRTTQPDYVYSIYKELSQTLLRHTNGVSAGYIRFFGAAVTSDFRVGWSGARIDARRPHPEIPLFIVNTGVTDNSPSTPVFGAAYEPFAALQSLELPSASRGLDFGMRGGQWELIEGVTWTRGRHVLNAGGALLLRRPEYLVSYLDQGLLYFGSTPGICFGNCTVPAQLFATARPVYYQIPVSRIENMAGRYVPSPPRGFDNYSATQFSGYLQENLRLTQRLALNIGIRYESFSGLLNTSRAQTFIEPGEGQWIQDRLARATLASERRTPYRGDNNDWAGRLGVSYNPWSGTVLRAGYGIFYDRLFDNLLLDGRNASVIGTFRLDQRIDLAQSPRDLFSSGLNTPQTPENIIGPTYNPTFFTPAVGKYQGPEVLDTRILHSEPLEMLWIDRNLRTPYVQSWFGSMQQGIGDSFQIEVNHSGALGRKLISSDLVNRPDGTGAARLNPALGVDILYRSNSGASSYMAGSVLARYRRSQILAQASYTYSHSIDNLSDPLLADVFNMASTNLDTVGAAQSLGVFTRQFDSRADRGSSDFDIRHNLVCYSILDVPAMRRVKWLERITENWKLAETATFRSGFPYTLFPTIAQTAAGTPVLAGARADIRDSSVLHRSREIPAGRVLIDVEGLSIAKPGEVGTLGRNALKGPGFWNVDLSVARSFNLPVLGDAGMVQISASAFNAFNHSNLGLPNPYTSTALYGPVENQTEFPAALPLFQTPRRIQLQLRVRF